MASNTKPATQRKVVGWGDLASPIWVVNAVPHTSDLAFGRIYTSSFGQQLGRLFDEAGIPWSSVRKEVVFPHPPSFDKIENLLQSRAQTDEELRPYLHASSSKFFLSGLFPHVVEFQKKLQAVKPNLVVAVGAEATALLTGGDSLSSVRGTLVPCVLDPSIKVLPVFHPVMLYRNFSSQAIFNADLRKVKSESQFPEIRRISREVFIPELVEELHDWWRENVPDTQRKLSMDIETIPAHRIITCVGFAASPTKSIVIPLYNRDSSDGSYWTHSEELYVHRFLRAALTHPRLEIIAHNGSYDTQWLYEQLRIPTVNYTRDTMLLHHSLYPEMRKSLGFLASIYTNEPAWKGMVKFTGKAGEKADS